VPDAADNLVTRDLQSFAYKLKCIWVEILHYLNSLGEDPYQRGSTL
jgi:hypothetical protein